MSSLLIRKGISSGRYASGTEKDHVPGFLLEERHRLFLDVRSGSDPGAQLLARFQQGADPRKGPVGAAEPIYGVEVHVSVNCNYRAKLVRQKPEQFRLFGLRNCLGTNTGGIFFP